MRHKHTLRKIRVNRILKKVDKQYEEYKKKYPIQPITSAHEEVVYSVEIASIKYWKGFNELIKKGTHK